MKLTRTAHFGLLLLLPVALMGCSSETASTPAASTSDSSTTASTTDSTTASTNTDSSTSKGKVTKVGDTGVQFSLPATWTHDKDSDLYSSADGNVMVGFQEIAENDEAGSIKMVKSEFLHDKTYKNYKEDGPFEKGKIGELDATEQTGTVDTEGVTVAWSIYTLKGKKPVIAYAIGVPMDGKGISKEDEKNLAEYHTLADSMKATG